MLGKPLLSHILDNEALTRGLGDPEARMLVEWLVDEAERLADVLASEAVTWTEVKQLCLRARAISRFVCLWCHQAAHGPAVQLAATERFAWPLPATATDPYELMQSILTWETKELALHLPTGGSRRQLAT